MNEKIAVVLAGGAGTRISAVLGALPKCLAPVGGTYFLRLLVNSLFFAGFDRVILSLGQGADAVLKSGILDDGRISYYREISPLGTGGALRAVYKHFSLSRAAVFNGDSIIVGSNYSLLLDFFSANNDSICDILTVYVNDCGRFGAIEFCDGKVKKFKEKDFGAAGFINSGAYCLDVRAFEMLDAEVFSVETDLFPLLIDQSNISALVADGIFFDIGVPIDYKIFADKFETSDSCTVLSH